MQRAIAASTAWFKPVSAGILLPLAAMILYYLFFYPYRGLLVVFAPQLLAYGAMGIGWRAGDLQALGLDPRRMAGCLLMGVPVGLLLGAANLWVILRGAPLAGIDYQFLRATPHARLPFWLLFPVGIFLIAVFVEVNFRGWFFGRLLSLLERAGRPGLARGGAVVGSALAFSFDPFMVAYFGVFHWLALSDGLAWGLLRLRMRSVWAPVAAHTVEVWLTYVVLKRLFA